MSLEILYILLCLSLIIGVIFLYKLEGKVLFTQINIFNWTYFVEFIAMGAVSPFIVYKYKYENVYKRQAITLPVGIFCANKLLKKLNFKYNYQAFIKKPLTNLNLKVFFPFWITLLSLYMVYIIYQIGFIPQIQMFNLNSVEIAQLRGQITHNLPANIIIFRLFALTIAPILALTSFINFITNKNITNACYFFILLLITIFFNTINLNKSSIVFFFIGILATFGTLNKNLGFKKLIGFGIAAYLLLTLTFIAVIPNQKQDYETTIKNVFGRITLAQTYGNYVSYYLFPKYEDHIGFKSISKQLRLLGIEPKERASRVMMKHMAPEKVKNGQAGHMVSTFFAEAWANWGLFGIIISPFLVGLILKLTVGVILNIPKTQLSLGFLSYLTYTFGLNKSFSKILLPRYLIASFVILFLFMIIEKKLLKKKSQKYSL